MESIVLPPEADEKKPLYQRLYQTIAADIKSGRLPAGEKLPSKRRLAAEARVSVNTVDTAYQMLAAEGYVDARAKSGFYVRRIERLQPPPARALPPQAEESAPAQGRYNFETASIDTALFPFKAWRRLQREVLAGDPALLNHGPRQGDAELRCAIAKYLHEYRGAQCTAQQIVVGAGIEYLLGILARLFCTETFAVENPGYARTHRILRNSGAAVTFVPVDGQGMSAAALAQSGAALAYVTPSHQFPTGVTMPVGRRTALLQWAARAEGRYLIEDDYDSEFRFDGKPLPSLQGLDESGRVIYISTFSKSVAPAIRIGYMVLPQDLLLRYQQEFGFYSSTVSRFEQQTLSRFMDEGHFARHLSRLRSAYRARRDVLVQALTQAFGESGVTVSGSHTGLHLLAQIHTGANEAQLVQAAQEKGVHLTGLSAYCQPGTPCPPATVVMGYAGLCPEQLRQAVALLKDAWSTK